MEELSKLKWRCRRGTLELDLLLARYLENNFCTADKQEQLTFLQLLELEDIELQPYLMGDKLPDSKTLAALTEKIRALNAPGICSQGQ